MSVSVSRAARLLALLLLLGGGSGCGVADGGQSRTPDRALLAGLSAPIAAPARQLFAPTSIWNRPIQGDMSPSTGSAAIVGALDARIADEWRRGGGPGIDTVLYSVPVYKVALDQARVRVRLVNRRRAPALQAAWGAVPLPVDARPAAGTDGHLVVWQPSTDRLWEFWQLARGGGGWQANWGGAMQHVSSASGVYGSQSWPGSERGWGASASSLSIAGGLITLEDLQRGEIDHALAMAVPSVRAGVYALPAQRTDGRSPDPLALPEGAHLRLDPALDLSTLNLPRFTLMLARAAQRYGVVVRDTAAHVTLYAQDPTPTGSNPYVGPHGYFEGQTPVRLLASFPWSHLQLLPAELRRAHSQRPSMHGR